MKLKILVAFLSLFMFFSYWTTPVEATPSNNNPVNSLEQLIQKLNNSAIEKVVEMVLQYTDEESVELGIVAWRPFQLTKETKGAYVGQVLTNSLAAKAGLQKSDVIKKIDDIEITSALHLKKVLDIYDFDETATFLIQREGKKDPITLSVPISKSNLYLSKPQVTKSLKMWDTWGLNIQKIVEQTYKKMQERGMVIT